MRRRATASSPGAQAEEAAGRAWRCLARAGEPRCPKGERVKLIERATVAFDEARAHLTEARRELVVKEGLVKEAEARATKATAEDRLWNSNRGPTPSEKGAVSALRPVVYRLTQDLHGLRDCLDSYRGGSWQRPPRSAEERLAQNYPFHSFSSATPPRCHWCGHAHGAIQPYSLDGEGYLVAREDARRFCCYRCFSDGADLAEPAPKPLPAEPAVEHVDSQVVDAPLRALPAHTRVLTGGTNSMSRPRGSA